MVKMCILEPKSKQYELIITGLQLQQLQFINNALSKQQELGESLRKAMQASDVPTQLVIDSVAEE
jgi:hypothetical protein